MTDTAAPASGAQPGAGEQLPEMFLLSADQRDFASTLKAYLEEHYGHDDLRLALDEDDQETAARWRRLDGELGLSAALIPAEHGGLGFGGIEAMVIAQELGRALYRGPWLASCVLAASALSAVSGPDAAAVLAEIGSGQATGCLADDELMSKRGGAAALTAEVADGGKHVVSGRARFVLDGASADYVLAIAQDSDGGSLYQVDRANIGAEPLETLDLTRPVAALTFDAAVATRLGGAGSAAAVRATVDPMAALVAAAESLGGMERCLDMATEYAKVRIQYGRIIGSYQAIKHKLADLLVLVEISRTAVLHAAWLVAAGDPDAPLAVHAAKAQASASFLRVAADNIQVHGGIGFTYDHDAHLFFRRAKSMQELLGSPDYHRDRIADLIGI